MNTPSTDPVISALKALAANQEILGSHITNLNQTVHGLAIALKQTLEESAEDSEANRTLDLAMTVFLRSLEAINEQVRANAAPELKPAPHRPTLSLVTPDGRPITH